MWDYFKHSYKHGLFPYPDTLNIIPDQDIPSTSQIFG